MKYSKVNWIGFKNQINNKTFQLPRHFNNIEIEMSSKKI